MTQMVLLTKGGLTLRKVEIRTTAKVDFSEFDLRISFGFLLVALDKVNGLHGKERALARRGKIIG